MGNSKLIRRGAKAGLSRLNMAIEEIIYPQSMRNSLQGASKLVRVAIYKDVAAQYEAINNYDSKQLLKVGIKQHPIRDLVLRTYRAVRRPIKRLLINVLMFAKRLKGFLRRSYGS